MDTGDKVTIGVLALVVLFVLGGFGFSIYSSLHTATYENCVVESKDRGGEGSDMRVYTENCGVFEVSDSLLQGRWDSADVYALIEPGEVYDFHTNSLRMPFLSMFPNILEATPA